MINTRLSPANNNVKVLLERFNTFFSHIFQFLISVQSYIVSVLKVLFLFVLWMTDEITMQLTLDPLNSVRMILRKEYLHFYNTLYIQFLKSGGETFYYHLCLSQKILFFIFFKFKKYFFYKSFYKFIVCF